MNILQINSSARAEASQSTRIAHSIVERLRAADPSATQWLNPAAFSLPALGTYGNEPVNDLLGPKSVQLDVAVTLRRENRMTVLAAANIPAARSQTTMEGWRPARLSTVEWLAQTLAAWRSVKHEA